MTDTVVSDIIIMREERRDGIKINKMNYEKLIGGEICLLRGTAQS